MDIYSDYHIITWNINYVIQHLKLMNLVYKITKSLQFQCWKFSKVTHNSFTI